MIELINVEKSYIDGSDARLVLHSTNFRIEKGEFVAIIGPSGSGKSTLLTILGGLQKPSQGEVLIDGEDIVNTSDKALTKIRFNKLGFVLQSSNLIPFLTVMEQMELRAKYEKAPFDKERATKILTDIGLIDVANQYPDTLSGGERQRAAIANVLYANTPIILADEPTASLDTERSLEVVKLLQKITKEMNRTVIMVTHDVRLLEYCDRILEIEDGILK